MASRAKSKLSLSVWEGGSLQTMFSAEVDLVPGAGTNGQRQTVALAASTLTELTVPTAPSASAMPAISGCRSNSAA